MREGEIRTILLYLFFSFFFSPFFCIHYYKGTSASLTSGRELTLCAEQSATDWLLLTVIVAFLITSIISFCHVQNSGIHLGTHLSAQLLCAAFTQMVLPQTHQTRSPLPCKSSIFSLSSLPLIFLHAFKWGSPCRNRQLFQSSEHISSFAWIFFSPPGHDSCYYSPCFDFLWWFKLCVCCCEWQNWKMEFEITKD